jgi:phospholipid/cholesterol/gamma-HCH transport system substrate-binding protein
METRAHYVLIGAVVLSAVAAGFLFILWLGQTQREFDEYDIIFTDRVSGLSVGAPVRFNGIQKGEVSTLTIDPDDPSTVIARVRVDKDTPVKTDTKAELELVGFTGLAIIQLVGGSRNAALLKNSSEDDTPKIKADTSGFAAFLEGSGDVLTQANRLLSDENIAGIAGIIAHIETLTGVIAENDEHINAMIGDAATVTANLAEASGKLNAAASSLQTLLEDDAPVAMRDADAVLKETQALVADLRGVVEENRASLRVFTDQGLAQVAPAMAEARRMMRTLDYILREIDRDPQAYLLGDSVPEYDAEEEQ